MARYPFTQVDVFRSAPLTGNPLAVVHGADGLAEDQLPEFARWTGLSETVFLLEPTEPEADYRVRVAVLFRIANNTSAMADALRRHAIS